MNRRYFFSIIIAVWILFFGSHSVHAASLASIQVSSNPKAGERITVSMGLPAGAVGINCILTITYSDGTKESGGIAYGTSPSVIRS